MWKEDGSVAVAYKDKGFPPLQRILGTEDA